MSPVVGGSKLFWTEFIEMYQSLPALWNVKSDSYKNRFLKNKAYDQLIVKLQEIEPNANREIARRKINSLRCSYRRELNKMKESQKFDKNNLYKTSLWYFNLLGFLEEQESQLKDQFFGSDRSEITSSFTPVPVENISLPQIQPRQPAIRQPVVRQPVVRQPPVRQPVLRHFAPRELTPRSPSPQLPPVKKVRSYIKPYSEIHSTPHQNTPPPTQNQSIYQDREVHICSSCPCIAAQENEYDKIGKAWASELQKMTSDQQIFAKRAIAEIIFEGQLGALHRQSVVINHVGQQMTTESSPSPFVVEKEEPDFDC